MAAPGDYKVLSDVHVYAEKNTASGVQIENEKCLSRFYFLLPNESSDGSASMETVNNGKGLSSTTSSSPEERLDVDEQSDLRLKRKKLSAQPTSLQQLGKDEKDSAANWGSFKDKPKQIVAGVTAESNPSPCTNSDCLPVHENPNCECDEDGDLIVSRRSASRFPVDSYSLVDSPVFACEKSGEVNQVERKRKKDSSHYPAEEAVEDNLSGDIKKARYSSCDQTPTSESVTMSSNASDLHQSVQSERCGGKRKQCTDTSPQKSCLEVITIEHKMETLLPDVGYQLWTGALLLCDYLLYRGVIGDTAEEDSSVVLDLGAGLGITSIVAAMFAPCVICTDYRSDIVAQAERNWQLNKWVLPRVRCQDITFRVLDWTCHGLRSSDKKGSEDKYTITEDDQHQLNAVSLILAAEVVYDDELTEAFFRTIYHLLVCPPAKNVLVTLEKRTVFRQQNLEVCIPAYEHFQENLADLVSVDEGPVRFHAEQISTTSFPQSFHYQRTKEMELWKISSRFSDIYPAQPHTSTSFQHKDDGT